MPGSLGNDKKFKKFALIDDEDEAGYQPTNKLTHRGLGLGEVKNFNDMRFDNDE